MLVSNGRAFKTSISDESGGIYPIHCMCLKLIIEKKYPKVVL